MGGLHHAVARSFAAFHADAPAQAADAIGRFRSAIKRQGIERPVRAGDHMNSIVVADQDGHLGAGLALPGCRLRGIEKLLNVLGEQAHWNSYREFAGEFEAGFNRRIESFNPTH
jgi:hypothetical protein